MKKQTRLLASLLAAVMLLSVMPFFGGQSLVNEAEAWSCSNGISLECGDGYIVSPNGSHIKIYSATWNYGYEGFSIPQPVRPGYIFMGWYRSSVGASTCQTDLKYIYQTYIPQGVKEQAGSESSLGLYTFHLWAGWKKDDNYTATKDPENGSTSTGTSSGGIYKATLTFLMNGAANLSPSTDWNRLVWTCDLDNYYNGDSAAFLVNDYVALGKASYAGYTLLGASIDKNAATNNSYIYPIGSWFPFRVNTTAYLIWAKSGISRINFITNGGTISDGSTYRETAIGSKITLSDAQANPKKPGYTFSGWYFDDDTLTTTRFNNQVATKSQHYLYAKWVQNTTTKYDVVFNLNGGKIYDVKTKDYITDIPTVSVIYGTNLTDYSVNNSILNSDPEKDDDATYSYEFLYWSLKNKEDEDYRWDLDNMTVYDNMVLHAIFKKTLKAPTTYTVTYQYVSGTSGKTLPTSVTTLLTKTSDTINVGSSVTPPSPASSTVTDGTGVWTFKGWTPTSATAATAFTGTWTWSQSTYNVTYQYASGTSGKTLPASVTNLLTKTSDTINVGSSVTPPSPASSTVTDGTGVWTFKGWNPTSATAATAFTGTWTWSQSTYNVTYQYASGTSGKTLPTTVTSLLTSPTGTFNVGTTATPPTPSTTSVVDGTGTWTFVGWNPKTATSATTFTGTWTWSQNTYTVNYQYASGTSGKTLPTTVTSLLTSPTGTFNVGTTATPPTPSKTSVVDGTGAWTFVGWNPKTATAATTFTGTWTWKSGTYTVSFDLNFDNPQYSVAPLTADIGKSVTIAPTDSYYLRYHKFLGWSESKTATTASYVGGSTYTNTKDVTLYAVWKRIEHTVSFDANGGSDAPASVIKYEGLTLVLPTKIPTLKGYSFVQWYNKTHDDNPAYSKLTWKAGGNFDYDIIADFTLRAEWAIVDYTIKYVFNNGGTNPSGVPTGYNINSVAITLPTPTLTGYAFVGWYENSALTGTAVKTIPTGSTGDKTYYAKFEKVLKLLRDPYEDGMLIKLDALEAFASSSYTGYAPLSKYYYVKAGTFDLKNLLSSTVTGVTYTIAKVRSSDTARPISSVATIANGVVTLKTTGYYKVTIKASGYKDVNIYVFAPGDVSGNGYLEASDCRMTWQHMINANTYPFDDIESDMADVNNDGLISAPDYRQMMIGIINGK